MKRNYQLMKDYLGYMGWNVEDILQVVNRPDDGLKKVEILRNEMGEM